ncbi:MAG: hypothetical protein K2L00_10635, partial [Muribaculaceae bacterium]|nr:hypothetical protein [Muribaculaceae bacterium]
MKKILLSSLMAAAAAVPAFAGADNINYQAVIKSGNNVVTNQTIELKFELLDNSEKVVYSEDQSVMTNDAGYVSCQLGRENDLTTIEWGDLTLRVSANLGGGYEVISTEAVSSVPTALYALRTADSDEIKEAVEELMQETELNKETILGINAEIVRLDGLTEEFATIEQVDQFATMNEARIDKLQEQVDQADKKAEEDYMDLKGSILKIETNLSALQGKQLEDNNALTDQIDAFATMNETRLDKMQNQMDLTDATVEENYDELKGFIERNEKNISVLQGTVNEKVEALENSLSAIASPTDPDSMMNQINNAMGELGEAVEGLVKENEETTSRLNAISADVAQIEGLAEKVDGLDGDLENIKENLTNAFEAKDAEIAEINGQLENLNNVAAVVRANSEANETLDADLNSLPTDLYNYISD